MRLTQCPACGRAVSMLRDEELCTTETSQTLKEWQVQVLFGEDYEELPVPRVKELRDTGDPTHPYSVRIGEEWVLARRSGLGDRQAK